MAEEDQKKGSLAEAILSVLSSSDPMKKVFTARRTARDWRLGRLEHRFDVEMSGQPSWPEKPELLHPLRMPKRKKGGSDRARIALLHSLAHIEFVAIDLAFDMAGRFGADFPPSFVDDWLSVGADEAMHFALLERRLRQMGSHYGALPAHAGLWEAAHDTRHDVLARLAIVPMVLEARGLDITPATVERCKGQGDMVTAKILDRIYHDEIRHVFAGSKWFKNRCAELSLVPEEHWKTLVAKHFRGALKPPFNDSARLAGGLTRDYYNPLV